MVKIKEKELFTYNAEVLKVVDGDTLDLSIDVGFGIHKIDRFRLYGLDTPESKGKDKCQAGLDVKKTITSMLMCQDSPLIYWPIRVKTYKQDKYGRYLALIAILKADGTEIDLNKYLIDNGLAKEYYGGKK